MSAAALCVAFATHAHDADTVAFYSFANLETGADACKLLFEGMATCLSSNNAYTVEFFYKLVDDAVAGGLISPGMLDLSAFRGVLSPRF